MGIMRRIRYCPSVAEVDSQVGATGIDRIDQCPSRAVVVSSEHSSVRTGPFSGQSLDPFSQAPTLVLTPCLPDDGAASESNALGARTCGLALAADDAMLTGSFTDLLGEAPMSYLSGWRLCLAADLLQRTDATVDSVAHEVGYSSGYALSTAFHREYGVRPSHHRRATGTQTKS